MPTVSTERVSDAAPPKTPRHVWIIGAVSLLWNSFGAMDYLMTQLRVEAYMSQFTPEQLEYFYGFPWWADGAWAIGVWGSVIGSIGILLRRAWAEWAFAASIAGLIGSSIYTLVLTDGMELMGGLGSVLFTAVIWLVAVGLFFYARHQANRGILR